MTEPKLLIFDLDGTLIDSQLDVTLAFNRVLENIGVPPAREDLIRSVIGTGVRPLLTEIASANGHHDLNRIFAIFDDLYAACLLDNTKLYPGVDEVLNSLDSLPKVVLTNKYQRFVDPILKGLGIAHHFQFAYGRDAFPKFKPDPLPVIMTCKVFNISPADAVVVGDTPTDIRAAKSAGAKSCAVNYGYGSKTQLEELNPEFQVDSAIQILKLFSHVGARI